VILAAEVSFQTNVYIMLLMIDSYTRIHHDATLLHSNHASMNLRASPTVERKCISSRQRIHEPVFDVRFPGE
jgi:hypothetical protein